MECELIYLRKYNIIAISRKGELISMLDLILVLCIAFLIISFISGLLGAKETGKEMKKDDGKEKVRLHGRIIEKYAETYDSGSVGIKVKVPMEWIVFEDDQGERKRLRNIRVAEIMLAAGDVGTIMFKGETIYCFERDK